MRASATEIEILVHAAPRVRSAWAALRAFPAPREGEQGDRLPPLGGQGRPGHGGVSRYAGTALAAPEPTGDLRTDLLALLAALRESLLGQDAALVLGLMRAMRDDPDLARTVRQAVLDHKRDAFAALLPERADHAWLAELTSAALLSRLLVTGEPLDDAFLAKLVDIVLLPQL